MGKSQHDATDEEKDRTNPENANPNRGLHEFVDGLDAPDDNRPRDVRRATDYDEPPLVRKQSRLLGGRHYERGERVTVAWRCPSARRGRVLYKEVRDSEGSKFQKYGKDGAYAMSTDALARCIPANPGTPREEHRDGAIERVLLHDQDNEVLYEFTALQWLDAGHPDNRTVSKYDRHRSDDEQRVVPPERAVQTWYNADKYSVLTKTHSELRAKANEERPNPPEQADN